MSVKWTVLPSAMAACLVGVPVNRGQTERETFEQFISSIGGMDESVSSSQTHTLRQLAGIRRLTQLLYASPQAPLLLATEFAPPSLTTWCLGCVYQVGEGMLAAITADSRQTSQEAMV